jgi:predicted component of type VI protein secretion system
MQLKISNCMYQARRNHGVIISKLHDQRRGDTVGGVQQAHTHAANLRSRIWNPLNLNMNVSTTIQQMFEFGARIRARSGQSQYADFAS